MNIKAPILFIIIFIAGSSSYAWQDLRRIPDFTKKDRVLILAPHPDDELLGAGGVMQSAIEAGARVKVCALTNGEHNELAFIVYEKRIPLRRGEFIHLGGVRRSETLKAIKLLGLSENDAVFLGYPDFGTMEIFTKYWLNTKPFRYKLTRISNVPCPECLSPGAPYVGESILSDLKKVLSDFKPTKVFVSHPVDLNRDHRALYLFLQVALWDLEGRIKRPQIFPYLIHQSRWPMPRGHHPDLLLEPTNNMRASAISWQKLDLSARQIKLKYDAIKSYKSQIEYNPPYLFTFARKNELFGDYPAIKLKSKAEAYFRWVESRPHFSKDAKKMPAHLSYALSDKNLHIKIALKKLINKNFGVYLHLIGYSKDIDFAKMPKINIDVNLSGMRVRDKKKALKIKGAKYQYRDKCLIITMPLEALGRPSYILAAVRTRTKDLPFDETGWRILDLR